MKPELDFELNKDTLLSNLKELEFISSFILYNRFNIQKKKLRKKLKKLIEQVEKDKTEKYLIIED